MSKQRLNNLFFFLGLAAVVVMLFTFDVSFVELWEHICHAGYWLIPIVGVWIIIYGINALSWREIILSEIRRYGGTGERVSFLRIYRLTITGYALNPARDLSPRLVYAILPMKGKAPANWPYAWVPVAAPVLGALAMSVPILNIVKNVIVATAGATSLTKWLSDGLVWFLDLWVLRFAFTFAIASLNFAFMFYMMPNAKVPFWNSVKGGMVTAVLFGGWMKLCSVAQVGIARSSALYGSFAFFPIVLAWMYMSWQIVLFGANLVKALQKEN